MERMDWRGEGFEKARFDGLTWQAGGLYILEIIIRCASYPEWLRDGPDDATATGSGNLRERWC